MKKALALILAGAMTLSLAACGGSSSSKETTAAAAAEQTQGAEQGQEAAASGEIRHDTLTVATSGEPQTLDPYAHSNQIGFVPTSVVFETLVKVDDNGEYIPWLATEWNWDDDLTLSMTLRDDVYFHNGEKMTSEDVAYSLNYAATSSFSSTLFNSIDTENIETPDETHVVIHLLSPNAAFMPALATHRGAIISKKAFEEMGAEQFGRNPIGTGPMEFVQWVTGDRLEFKINENYWGNKIAYDNLIVRFITEASSRAIELESGGVDVAMELASSDWSRIEENPNTQLITGESLTTTFLVLNNSIAPLDDMRVREALAYGTNMEALVATVWQGSAVPATNFYAASLLGHKAMWPHEYDVEKAKSLLAEAGYADGLTLKYFLYDNAVNTAVAEVLQNMWKEIGITLDLQVVDVATFTSYNNNGEITMAHMSTTAAIPDPSAALVIWPTSRTISLRHNDTKVDEYLESAKATYDETERAAIYGELQEYLYSKTYAIPVAYSQAAYGASSKITNFPFYANLVPDLTRIQFTE